MSERRMQDRIKLQGYLADLADGCRVYGGIVENISTEGFCLTDLPSKFAVQPQKYCIVISGKMDSKHLHYKMTVFPCWKKQNTTSMDVGFRITEVPERWRKFVREIVLQQLEEW